MSVWEATGQRSTVEEVIEAMRPPDLSSGDHVTDWRCPLCHDLNSIKRRACATCNGVPPGNQRLTRAALRERRAEHINGCHSLQAQTLNTFVEVRIHDAQRVMDYGFN